MEIAEVEIAEVETSLQRVRIETADPPKRPTPYPMPTAPRNSTPTFDYAPPSPPPDAAPPPRPPPDASMPPPSLDAALSY